jgi:hypothetical protein
MSHIKLKASTEIKIGFNPKELDDRIVPEESKNFAQRYLSSNKLAEDENLDIMMMFEDKIVFGFDYLHEGKKRIVVEINPVTIFFSNSVMSFGMLNKYKKVLLSQSSEVGKINDSEPVNLSHYGMFFQLAINCIINLQATLESLANRIIPVTYPFLDKTGNPVDRTVTYKLFNAIPNVKKIDFQKKSNRKHNIAIDKLIKIRNNIIHLKPKTETNTGYKGVYRELLDFDYSKTVTAVKTFVNFYEPNLIEECLCGIDFYFDRISEE